MNHAQQMIGRFNASPSYSCYYKVMLALGQNIELDLELIDSNTDLGSLFGLLKFNYSKTNNLKLFTPKPQKMDSRQISQLFHNSQSNQEDLNPLQTFGNRKNNVSERLVLKSSKKPNRPSQRKQHILQQYDLIDENEGQKETRIKLLTSYQQSYLQSVSQPLYTEQDQRLQDEKANNKLYMLSYSESKGPGSQILDKYLHSGPEEQIPPQNPKIPKTKIMKNSSEQNFIKQQAELQTNQILSKIKKQQTKKLQNNRDKIKILQQAIDEQLYNMAIQEKLYKYLMERIDNRSRLKKQLNTHLIVEKTIDFLDAGEQFMKQFMKLKSMANI